MKTLAARIEKNLTTKSGAIAVKFLGVVYLINNPTMTIKPVQWTGTRNHMRLKDNSANIMLGLSLLGIDFETGNNAPRGGKEGFFIRLTKKGQKQVSFYNKERIARIESAKMLEAEKAAAKKAEITATIAAMPENAQFEARWNSHELKNASGLSWSVYRESLKQKFPVEWHILKAKFKAQQSFC